RPRHANGHRPARCGSVQTRRPPSAGKAGIDPTRHGISRMDIAMGISVTIIDDSDRVGYAASMTRAGELYMTSVTDMVTKVLAYLATYSPPVSPHAITAYAMSHGRVPLPTPPAPGTTKMSRLDRKSVV